MLPKLFPNALVASKTSRVAQIINKIIIKIPTIHIIGCPRIIPQIIRLATIRNKRIPKSS